MYCGGVCVIAVDRNEKGAIILRHALLSLLTRVKAQRIPTEQLCLVSVDSYLFVHVEYADIPIATQRSLDPYVLAHVVLKRDAASTQGFPIPRSAESILQSHPALCSDRWSSMDVLSRAVRCSLLCIYNASLYCFHCVCQAHASLQQYSADYFPSLPHSP